MIRNGVALSILLVTSLWTPTVTSAQSTIVTAEPPILTIPVVVTDAQGAPVRGITPADLGVRVNKTPVKITEINTSMDSPLRLAVLIDTSKSQNSHRSLPAAVNALWLVLPHVIDTVRDRALVITFGDTPTATDFMNRNEMSQFSMDLRPHGGTALYDAIALACNRFSADSAAPARRVLIVLTDGDDNTSHISHYGAIKALQRAHAIMFWVDTGDNQPASRDEGERRHIYNEFAEKTGSIFYVENPAQDMSQIFSSIKQQIDSIAIVNCVAPESDKKGHYAIEIGPATHKEWRVHAPQGYDDK